MLRGGLVRGSLAAATWLLLVPGRFVVGVGVFVAWVEGPPGGLWIGSFLVELCPHGMSSGVVVSSPRLLALPAGVRLWTIVRDQHCNRTAVRHGSRCTNCCCICCSIPVAKSWISTHSI